MIEMNTDFFGVSGQVKFSINRSNDRIYEAFFVLNNLQLDNNKLRFIQIMQWYETNQSKWTNFSNSEWSLVWPNGSKQPPTHDPHINGKQIFF